MSEQSQQPPSEGWYSLAGNPDDLAYFDGRLWTWRRQRDAGGEWRQEPIIPPSLTTPLSTTPGSAPPSAPQPGAPSPTGSSASTDPYAGLPTYPGYPGASTYGNFASGQWGAGAAAPPRGAPPGHLDFQLSEPEQQARWKTLLRLLLALPNVVVLVFMEIAVFVVTILMWFAALFTAKVPEGMWSFSVGVLKWQARTYSYLYFLTDAYPPFQTGDADYPVSLTLRGPPDRLNRWSVFFRVILAIPAGIVSVVFLDGIGVFSIAAWVITLVTGRCPRPLHLVFAAALRYSLRFNAFFGLLTTEYPSRPLGDTATYGTEPSLQDGDIVLSGSAKALAVVAIIVGVLAYFGSTAIPTLAGVRVKAQQAITRLNAMESRTLSAATQFESTATSCKNTLPCLRNQAIPILLHSLDTQISTLTAITFPTPQTQNDANALIVALQNERDVVTRMRHAGSTQALSTDLKQLVRDTQGVQPLATRLANDLNAVR
jgi:hypothetical protein